jgi:hypothetical protein
MSERREKQEVRWKLAGSRVDDGCTDGVVDGGRLALRR